MARRAGTTSGAARGARGVIAWTRRPTSGAATPVASRASQASRPSRRRSARAAQVRRRPR
ncbi:hypothetical protein BMAGB8_2531, partial [Burkholderia mallei GB8 horse 4]